MSKMGLTGWGWLLPEAPEDQSPAPLGVGRVRFLAVPGLGPCFLLAVNGGLLTASRLPLMSQPRPLPPYSRQGLSLHV